MANWSYFYFAYSGKHDNIEKFTSELYPYISHGTLMAPNEEETEVYNIKISTTMRSCSGSGNGKWGGPVEWIASLADKYNLIGHVYDMEPGMDFFIYIGRNHNGSWTINDTYISPSSLKLTSTEHLKVLLDHIRDVLSDPNVPMEIKDTILETAGSVHEDREEFYNILGRDYAKEYEKYHPEMKGKVNEN